MNTSRPSSFRRAVLVGGVALVVAASTLSAGVSSYLKPTATASAPVSAVPLTTMTVNLSAARDSNSADPMTADSTVYEIQSANSAASFSVDEVLRGSPYTVVGTTDQIAGQIAFDLADPSTAQVGTILINARTLTTDDESRTRALGNRILNTDQYEYISFMPTELSGLPERAALGQPFSFQMTGNLTIKDVTRPATFDVTVTPAADGSLDGSASTRIRYSDWGVSIPSVPFVASVGDQVVLHLDFNAGAAA
jgi:polyisoprenoid-binding protein YceI